MQGLAGRNGLMLCMAATLASSMAFVPSPISYPASKWLDAGAMSRGLNGNTGRYSSVRMSLITRRDLGKGALLGGTAMAPLLLGPKEGQCKSKRSGDGGKWARHYGKIWFAALPR